MMTTMTMISMRKRGPSSFVPASSPCLRAMFFRSSQAAFISAFRSVRRFAIPVRRFSRTVDHLARFVSTPQCLLFVAGVAFAVVVAQLVGYKEIWNRIFDVDIWNDACAARLLDDGRLPHDLDVSRHVKNTVEESIELASYLLILGSAVIPPLLRSGAPESRRA